MPVDDSILNLTTIIDDSLECINTVGSDLASENCVQARISDYVISFAFLEVYRNWESFLEETAVLYSLGNESTLGNKPTCYISPLDSDHAYNLIKGAAMYPDWSNHLEVIKYAETLFENGEPYKSILQGVSSYLREMKTIRNAISHNSAKSRDDFDNLVRGKLSPGEVGITVSRFLVSQKSRKPMFVKDYFTALKNSAIQIASY
jgi:hypothetical protein